MKKLRRYQSAGLWWCLSRDRIALFWEMRLGKTIVCIRWIKEKNPKSTLILCPSAVKDHWQEELLEDNVESEIANSSSFPPETGVLICSYDCFRSNRLIQNKNWDCVVLDESDAIKNPKTKTSQFALKSFRHTKYRAILTGTPDPEERIELVNQIIFLLGSFLGKKNYWDARASLFELGYGHWDWLLKKEFKIPYMKSIGMNCHVLTRKSVGVDIKHVYEVRTVEMPKVLRKKYDKCEKEYELDDVMTVYNVVVHTWLRQLAGGCMKGNKHPHKIKLLKELIKGELKKEQCVIWYNFIDEMEEISDLLNKEGVSYSVFTGTDEKKRLAVSRFKNGKSRFLLSHCDASIKYGVNLSFCDTNIYFSLPYGLKSWLQSKDRILVPGKTGVMSVILQVKDSIEEDIWRALRSKNDTFRSFKQAIIHQRRKRLKNSSIC